MKEPERIQGNPREPEGTMKEPRENREETRGNRVRHRGDALGCGNAASSYRDVAVKLHEMSVPLLDVDLAATTAIQTMGRPDAETIPIIALMVNVFNEDVQKSLQAGLNA